MGRLIPAGTGMAYYRSVKIAGEDVEEDLTPEQEPAVLDNCRIRFAASCPAQWARKWD